MDEISQNVKEDYKMAKAMVLFEKDLCKGCELCVSVCPKKIIKIDEKSINNKGYQPAYIDDMDECIGCANCAMICPDSVITVQKL